MDKGLKFLSDVAFYRTYSATLPSGYKETWDQVVDRYETMMMSRFPQLTDRIHEACFYIRLRVIVPSMRMLQFAGPAIEREPMRGFNCSYTANMTFKDFADNFYVLMCGTGNGFSVQSQHTAQLPIITCGETYTFVIPDSKEGWSDSILRLLENPNVRFDYSQIRARGIPLSTGGTASGPEPLKLAHEIVRGILRRALGRKLTPVEVLDIECHLSDVVVVGGVRRSARIALGSKDDLEFRRAKTGKWWEKNPQRARSNNSVVLHRGETSFQEFSAVLDDCFDSMAGEPGIFWTSNYDFGTNPCAEIALHDSQVCNLTEINMANVLTVEEFRNAVWAATFLGTLQASFTQFNYVAPKWRAITEKEALLGVSMTGLAQNWKFVQQLIKTGSMYVLAEYMRTINTAVARAIGINPAARIGCVKPSGTTSATLGTSSGIHAAYGNYFLRRVRVDKSLAVGRYLESELGGTCFLEEDKFNPDQWVVTVPCKMDSDIYRQKETAVQLMKRGALIHENWIAPSHRYGDNTHNVSMTVSYKESEREKVKLWMWNNRFNYAGISLLPRDDHTYVQAPFEDTNETTYNMLSKELSRYNLNLGEVFYGKETDNRQGELACQGGVCELR